VTDLELGVDVPREDLHRLLGQLDRGTGCERILDFSDVDPLKRAMREGVIGVMRLRYR
jgi:hypothetical protein